MFKTWIFRSCLKCSRVGLSGGELKLSWGWAMGALAHPTLVARRPVCIASRPVYTTADRSANEFVAHSSRFRLVCMTQPVCTYRTKTHLKDRNCRPVCCFADWSAIVVFFCVIRYATRRPVGPDGQVQSVRIDDNFCADRSAITQTGLHTTQTGLPLHRLLFN